MDSLVMTRPPAAQDTGARALGLMRIGPALLALPVEAIREVVPGRDAYAMLPMRAVGLRGGANMRGTVVPVLDLRLALGITDPAPADHVVVVMRWQGRLLGLVMDAVCDMAKIADHCMFALETGTATPGASLATHGFVLDDRIGVLLDPERIAALPNVPMVAEEARQGHDRRRVTLSPPLLLFTAGESHLGIAALHVDATVPRAAIRQNALTGGVCLGVIEHHGHEVAVVDTLAALGIATGPRPAEAAVLILRYPDGMLAFVLDEVRDIVRVPETEILPMPALALDGPNLFGGMLTDAAGRQNLILAADMLRAHPTFVTLAALRNPIATFADGAGAVSGGRPAATGREESYLTFSVNRAEQASPLVHVAEILPFPPVIVPVGSANSGLIGLFDHRGTAIPLLCLATLLGRSAPIDRNTARILLVLDEDCAVGFVVEALHSIEQVRIDGTAACIPTSTPGAVQSLVLIGSDDSRRMVPRLDLLDQAKRVTMM